MRHTAEDRLKAGWGRVDARIEERFDDGDIAQAFKADAAAIEEAPVPVSAHAALFAIITLLIMFVLWAVFGSVDRIVVAPGKIATRTPMVASAEIKTGKRSIASYVLNPILRTADEGTREP